MIDKVIYFNKDIRNVTSLYYEVMLSALRKNNVELQEYQDLNFDSNGTKGKTTYVIVTQVMDCVRLYLRGYRNFIYWFQGIEPEEHFLMNQSRLKFRINSWLEKFVLKVCEYKIGVSKYQFEHYNKKYSLHLSEDNYFVMPCFNTRLNEEGFTIRGKYEHNTFCYAGGMQAWQGVDYIFKMFSELETKYQENLFLKIFTKDLEATKELLSQYPIKNYTVQSVTPEELDKEMSKCKFGFILREDNIINNVATPTKLSAYLANGVIPIYTSSIRSYKDLADKFSYLCCLDGIDDIEPVERMIERDCNADDILSEYKKIFATYYSVENYIEGMKEFFSK